MDTNDYSRAGSAYYRAILAYLRSYEYGRWGAQILPSLAVDTSILII